MDTERESNTSGYSATEALYVALRGVDTEHIAEVIVERDPQGEPGPSLIRAVLREIPAADCATQRHLEIGREEFQNRDLAPVGPQSRQARPRGPTLFSTMSVPWPSCYIARLLPIQKAISRSDQDGVLLGEDRSTTRASGEQATEDRLDPVPLAGLVEVDRAEQLAVVGHGQRRHPHAGRLGEQVVHTCGSVQHRVLGVDVEMYEAVRHAVPRRLDPSKTLTRVARGRCPQAVDQFSTRCGQNYTRVS